jgi:hypothetical protein
VLPLEQHLNARIEAQQRAEEEQVSRESLRAIQRAFREALLALPPEEYDWFDIQARARSESGPRGSGAGNGSFAAGEAQSAELGLPEPDPPGATASVP